MTDIEKQEIAVYRQEGYSYTSISKMMDLSINSIKTYCKRHGLGGVIYKLFLQGYSAYKIALQLTELEIPTPIPKKKWQQSTVMSILTNENIKGMLFCRNILPRTSLPKSRKRTTARFCSIMWKHTMRQLFQSIHLKRCRQR